MADNADGEPEPDAGGVPCGPGGDPLAAGGLGAGAFGRSTVTMNRVGSTACGQSGVASWNCGTSCDVTRAPCMDPTNSSMCMNSADSVATTQRPPGSRREILSAAKACACGNIRRIGTGKSSDTTL